MAYLMHVGARLLSLAAVAVLMVALSGCGTSSDTPPAGNNSSGAAPASKQVGKPVQTAGGSYTNLTPAELKPMLDNKDFFLVDTHTPPEGRLPKTDARIQYDQIEAQVSKLPADKSAKIVLTCMSGAMSTEASKTLVRLGYTNVFNLDGGMSAWRAAGYELVPEGK